MSAIKTTPECVLGIANLGNAKANQGLVKALALGFLAGAYIGLGCLFAIKVAGNLPPEWGNISRLIFGGVFPVGLLMVLVAGADLFTGNCMALPSAVMNGTTGIAGLLRSWFTSYVGNFVGSIFVAFFLGVMATVLFDKAADGTMPLATYAVKLANMKCNLSFAEAFWRGVGCNWLVCLAVFMSSSASDGVSKVAVFWPPITCFVALGFEHSVANMCFIPLGLMLGTSDAYLASAGGAPVALTATWDAFFVKNLLPVTLGNIVGALVLVSMFYQTCVVKAKGNK